MMTFARAILGALVLLAAAGCGEGGDSETVVRRKGEPDMIRVKAEDEKMNAAIRQARATVNDFVSALKSPKPNETGFAVKKPFPYKGGGPEHIWLVGVSFDGKVFHGEVNNEPVSVKSVKLGDRATVSPSELSDWMYVRDGKLVGGQTIRALFDMSTPAGRKKFEAETGLKLD